MPNRKSGAQKSSLRVQPKLIVQPNHNPPEKAYLAPVGELVGFAASCADEPVAPGMASGKRLHTLIVRKQALDPGRESGKWQIRTGQDDGRHGGISFPALNYQLGVDRISMETASGQTWVLWISNVRRPVTQASDHSGASSVPGVAARD
jgi:hypothetical protein